ELGAQIDDRLLEPRLARGVRTSQAFLERATFALHTFVEAALYVTFDRAQLVLGRALALPVHAFLLQTLELRQRRDHTLLVHGLHLRAHGCARAGPSENSRLRAARGPLLQS